MEDKDLFAAISNAIWSDVKEEDDFPRPLLAHYCSIATAESILACESFWLSNPLFMNDLEEVRFGFMRGRDLALTSPSLDEALGSDEHRQIFKDALEHLFDEFNNREAFDCYVGCFSEHRPDDYDGRLSMWRAYGAEGDGAAIVLDLNAVSKPDTKSAGLVLGRVHYGTRDKRNEWIQEKIEQLATLIKSLRPSGAQLGLVAHIFVERIKLMAIFSKHSGFEEEAEWRLVYLRQHDQDKVLVEHLGYHVGERGIEPKLKLPVRGDPLRQGVDLSLSTLVERVLLGPCISSPLASMSFKRMLEIRGKSELASRVSASTIPLRPRRDSR